MMTSLVLSYLVSSAPSLGQSYVLQGLFKISSPSHGFPSLLFGGTHYLYIVYVPPPQLTVHYDQS